MSAFVKAYPRARVSRHPRINGWVIDLVQREGARPQRVAATYATPVFADRAARVKLGVETPKAYVPSRGLDLGPSTPDPSRIVRLAPFTKPRATMYDVPRFAEVHQYEAIMTENVVEVTAWKPFRGWLQSMGDLGYEHKIISLNSMHAQAFGPGAPQSRDRVYIVFWRKGNKAPDFERLRPMAECEKHGMVRCIQAFKDPSKIVGKYRQQYVYRCPHTSCRNAVLEPAVKPASDAIDWSIKGARIGDRKKPLAAATMRQIVEGLNRYPNAESILTQFYGSPSPKPTTDPYSTFTTRDRHGLVVTLRSNAVATPASEKPFTTITAGGNHHGLMTYTEQDVADVAFRMIQPHEQMWGMDFPKEYTILGTMKERTMQAGNAVTPPAARDLASIVAASLEVAA